MLAFTLGKEGQMQAACSLSTEISLWVVYETWESNHFNTILLKELLQRVRSGSRRLTVDDVLQGVLLMVVMVVMLLVWSSSTELRGGRGSAQLLGGGARLQKMHLCLIVMLLHSSLLAPS